MENRDFYMVMDTVLKSFIEIEHLFTDAVCDEIRSLGIEKFENLCNMENMIYAHHYKLSRMLEDSYLRKIAQKMDFDKLNEIQYSSFGIYPENKFLFKYIEAKLKR